MPKIQHVYLEVMPDGKVMEGFPAKKNSIGNYTCEGCEVRLEDSCPPRCLPRYNPLKKHIIYKDTGKRVRKG